MAKPQIAWIVVCDGADVVIRNVVLDDDHCADALFNIGALPRCVLDMIPGHITVLRCAIAQISC